MTTDAQTERRIAAALSARARGITMSTSTLEERFAQVQEHRQRDRRRRRATAVAAAALATAAAVLGAFALAGGVLGGEDAPTADRARTEVGEQGLIGSGTVEPGRTYTVQDFSVPFTFEVPEPGEVPGTWRYHGAGDIAFSVGLDRSPSTGGADVVVTEQDAVYDPSRPWASQEALVDAPRTAQEWRQWFEDTGYASVGALERVTIDGLPATRMSVEVADLLPDGYQARPEPPDARPPAGHLPNGCAPRDTCLATGPFFAESIGWGFQAGLRAGSSAEVTVIGVGGRTVLATASGAPGTRDQWLPLLRSVVDSLRFA